MATTTKQKFLVVLLLVVFTAFVFVAFTTSKNASSLSLLNNTEELVAHADMSGGNANAENRILSATSWTSGGIGRQSATNLNSITFDATNVSYYRTTASGAECSITLAQAL